MRRVGSSKMKMPARVSNHLARTTFCWLPPERRSVCWPALGVLIRSASIKRRAAGQLGPPRADQTGDAEHFPPTDFERDVVEDAAPAESLDAEGDGTGAGRLL